jgi:hypothetical protein
VRLIELKTVPVLNAETVYMEDLVATTSSKSAATDVVQDADFPFAVHGLELEDEDKNRVKSGEYGTTVFSRTRVGYSVSHCFWQ